MDNTDRTAQNVITMVDFQADSGFSALAQVEAYWDALRAGRLMPNRADIDPRGIEAALEYAFIVERIAPGIARLRIAGSHLSDLMGMEVRGMPLSALFASSARRQLADLMEEVFERPATATLHLGHSARAARMILLPLKSDMGDVSRILGCLVAPEGPARAPCRFEIANSAVRPILANAPVRGRTPVQPPGLADPANGFDNRGHVVPSRRLYLRLVRPDE